MKGDFTRLTFKKEKHYSSVRMQQGRVQVDADWNEQADITLRRIETEAADLIGGCGGPLHYPGFHLVADVNALNPEEQKLEGNQNPPTLESGDLYVSAGRYYVDGVQTENDLIIALSKQPYLPDLEAKKGVLGFGSLLKKAIGKGWIDFDLPETNALYQAYLDVWQRHLTALEDPSIREKALGGPDTATRTQTVWQVKLLKWEGGDAVWDGPAPPPTCLSSLNLPKSTGQLMAQTIEVVTPPNPCVVPESAGYRGLENQLYRVEIHQGGAVGPATFKWSRENGSVVTRWTGQDTLKPNVLTVESPGRDAVLGFSTGDWVELTDDLRELWGLPGTMVQVETVEGTTLTVKKDPPATSTPLFADFQGNPKIRRWDHNKGSQPDPKEATLKVKEGEWIDLEQGVQVWFDKGGIYRTGDYWLIPARTANADTQSGQIEWPAGEFLPPHGIQHHYCPLAVLTWDGTAFTSTDCRKLFPPVTELTSLLYVSGDGQEAMPGRPLPQPMRVRVANGQHPVIGAKVQFTLVSGGGSLSVSTPVDTTGPDGIAQCNWTLGTDPGPNQDPPKQQVQAVLLDAASTPITGQVVGFNANLSIASQVAYDPGECITLQEQKTVQKAIDRLSHLTSLSYLGGDGQDAMPGEVLPQLVQVIVTNECGPVGNAKVRFVAQGNGLVAADKNGLATATSNPLDVTTLADGIASCAWLLDPNLKDNTGKLVATQQLTASLITVPTGNSPAPPTSISFTGNLSIASQVAYDPAKCDILKGVTNVQDALDGLCQKVGGKVSTGLVIFQNMRGGETRLSPLIAHGLEVGYVAIIMALEIEVRQPPPPVVPPRRSVVMGDLDSSFPESPLMVAHYTPTANVFSISLKDRRVEAPERTWSVRWWAIPKTLDMGGVTAKVPQAAERFPREFLLMRLVIQPGMTVANLASDLGVKPAEIQPELNQLRKEERIRIDEVGRLFPQ